MPRLSTVGNLGTKELALLSLLFLALVLVLFPVWLLEAFAPVPVPCIPWLLASAELLVFIFVGIDFGNVLWMSSGDVSGAFESNADRVACDFGYDCKVSSFGPYSSCEQLNCVSNLDALTGGSDGSKPFDDLVLLDL